MDYDDEIDRLEERFRDPEFRAQLSESDMENIQEVYFEFVKKLAGYNRAIKTNEPEEFIEQLNEGVLEILHKCKELAGLR